MPPSGIHRVAIDQVVVAIRLEAINRVVVAVLQVAVVVLIVDLDEALAGSPGVANGWSTAIC